MLRKKWFLAVFFAIAAILFLLEYKIVGQAVYGDGRYYWAITRSIYFQHNLDVSDEMDHTYSPENNNRNAYTGYIPRLAKETKRVVNSFSLGVSIFWLPFYFLADLITMGAKTLGFNAVRNGYSDIYQITVGLGNVFFITAGLGLLERALSKWYSDRVTILALALILFATNLLYYGSLDVINSHPLSFLLSSILVYLFFRFLKGKENFILFLGGAAAGLLAANRTQDGLYLLIPFTSAFYYGIKGRKFSELVLSAAIILTGFFIGYSPQLLILHFGLGSWMIVPHGTPKFDLVHPHFSELIFNTKLGLFFYMPSVIASFAGLFYFSKREKTAGIIFISVCILEFILIGSWKWWDQASYTMRYFISSFPFLIFGIAEIINRMSKNISLKKLYVIAGFLILHQFIMIAGFKIFREDPTYIGGELTRSGKIKTQIIKTVNNALPRFSEKK